MASTTAADAAAAGVKDLSEEPPAWFHAVEHQYTRSQNKAAAATKRQRDGDGSTTTVAVAKRHRPSQAEPDKLGSGAASHELTTEEDVAWLQTFETRFRMSLTDAVPGRVCVWISLAGADAATGSTILERAARHVQWPDQELVWHGAKAPHVPDVGLGFKAEDLYGQWNQTADGAKYVVDSGWILPSGSKASVAITTDALAGLADRPGSGGMLTICFSMKSPVDGWNTAEVLKLAAKLRCDIGTALLAGIRVHIVSGATKLPLVALPDGISTVRATTSESGIRLLHDHGICYFPGAVGSEHVASLRRVVSAQIARIEMALLNNAHCSGIGDGTMNFAEVMHRGPQRWDMVLVRGDGSRVGVKQQQTDSKEAEAYALLERIMRDSPWVPVLRASLGGTDDYVCQAGAIVSRPGAPCGKWHTDGGHPSFNIFEGESGAPLSVCVFIPLVDLSLPQLSAARISKQAQPSCTAPEELSQAVTHGRGCTAFWPGSHRHPEVRLCPRCGSAFPIPNALPLHPGTSKQASTLGSVAAQAGACVSGAPMRAGDALGYDYRTVHCATPNDAVELGADGERPVLQLTYSKRGYDPDDGNYGSERLFGD